MSEIKATMTNIKVNHTQIDIPRILPAHLQLQVDWNAQFKLPKDPNQKSMMVIMGLDIHTDETEDYKISLEADSYFNFDVLPEDPAKVAEELCIPMTKTRVAEVLDQLLTTLGHPALQLFAK